MIQIEIEIEIDSCGIYMVLQVFRYYFSFILLMFTVAAIKVKQFIRALAAYSLSFFGADSSIRVSYRKLTAWN